MADSQTNRLARSRLLRLEDRSRARELAQRRRNWCVTGASWAQRQAGLVCFEYEVAAMSSFSETLLCLTNRNPLRGSATLEHCVAHLLCFQGVAECWAGRLVVREALEKIGHLM